MRKSAKNDNSLSTKKKKKKKVSKKLKRLTVGTLISAILTAIIFVLGSVQAPLHPRLQHAAEGMEYLFYDFFFKEITEKNQLSKTDNSVINTDHYDPNIVIVDIDEASLNKLGSYTTWNRDIHAKVVENLTKGGASAIGFDIMFKEAHFGIKKTGEALNILSDLENKGAVSINDPSLVKSSILSNYNYDSMLVEAVTKSNNTIVCYDFGERLNYKYESQWGPLSNKDRANEIGYGSTFNLSNFDRPDSLESKDLLDNVFPELAHAASFIGAVNAYPDDDGVSRRIQIFYRFPDIELNPALSMKDQRAYSTLPFMTILHLFHQRTENVVVKMGQYVDVGKPFGVFRDSSGNLQTTFPHFSYQMFKALQETIKRENQIVENTPKGKLAPEFIDVSSKIVALRDNDNFLTITTSDKDGAQFLTERQFQAIRTLDTNAFARLNAKLDSNTYAAASIAIDGGFTLSRNPEKSDKYDLIDPEEEDDDIVINPYITRIIQLYADSIENLQKGETAHLSMSMDIRYDLEDQEWKSSLIILSPDVLKDILDAPMDVAENLKKGEEIRFGNVRKIPIDNRGRYLINYRGRFNTNEAERGFQHISYYDVLKERIDDGFYQGKIFILGSAATGMFDFISAPHEEHYPGVLVHATIIQNILNSKFLVFLSEHNQIIIHIILALLCTIIGLFIKSYISIPIMVAIMLGYVIIAYNLFTDGLYIGVSRQLITILLTNIAALIIQFYFENREKNFINNAFKQYISPELIEAMVSNEVMPTLGGQKSNITAYFTDIASFSTFSEQIGDPKKLVDLLNEYLTVMTDCLLANKGTLDKYEGDAIIAFFGAPMKLPNHAQNACEVAVEMQKKLVDLRAKWAGEEDWPLVVQQMHMRIGINSGDIVTGNMGSSMRKNYTMMGDAVNLAARLESAAKQYGAYIQISEDTQKQLEQGVFIYRSLDTIRVVGKSQPVKTFELLAKVDTSEFCIGLITLVGIWEKARSAYLAMDWDRAIELFTQCLAYEPHLPEHDPGSKTCPSLVYIERCKAYKLNPPVAKGETWDGVFTATNK